MVPGPGRRAQKGKGLVLVHEMLTSVLTGGMDPEHQEPLRRG
jgi:LDH2 family malate/lactate/ureidoglycolate dehydrogenase